MATTLRYPKGYQFRDENDAPVSGGKLSYYRAGTTTPLTTYSNAAGTTANTTSNGAIILDGAGRLAEAVYLGSNYDAKEVLLTNLEASVSPWPDDGIPRAQVFEAVDIGFAPPLTSSLSLNQSNSPYTLSISDAGKLVLCSTAGGNLIINLPPAAALEDGQGYWFYKPVGANMLIVQANGTDTIGGASAYYATAARKSFAIVSNGAQWVLLFDSDHGEVPQPGGRLTLASGVPVLGYDVAGAGTVYYTAFTGNTVPIWNGSYFEAVPFSADLALTLTSAFGADSAADVFAFRDDGELKIGFGPVWDSATAGACDRGTGAGTSELERTLGLLTNANEITATNGGGAYTVAAGYATFLGSILADETAGKVSCLLSIGQARRCGVWNAHNRQDIILQEHDPAESWNYSEADWRPSNDDEDNCITAFTGLPEEFVKAELVQHLKGLDSDIVIAYCGIGVNNTTSPSGMIGSALFQKSAANSASDAKATYIGAPGLGVLKFTSLEKVSSGGNPETFYGGQQMLLTVSYRG